MNCRPSRVLHAVLRHPELLLLAWFIPVSAGAQGTNAAPVTMEQVARAMSQVQAVFTRFVQERHLSLFSEPLRSEGYLCCQKPGRLRWEIVKPYQSILVSDGSGVAQFEWMNGRWQKLELGLADAMQNVVGQIASVIEGGYANNSREFTASVANSEGGPVITLTPRNEKVRKMIQAIEVHLAADLQGTRRVILRENNADFTDIRFDEQTANRPLPAGTFDRSKPLPLESVRDVVRGAAGPGAKPGA
jgi:outer membrane lipoprotein-sorting protein